MRDEPDSGFLLLSSFIPHPSSLILFFGEPMQTLWQDLRYGARMLFKHPGFTLIAVCTLALGIGANTAIFSVVNAVLLRPLPFAEQERLVWCWGSTPSGHRRAAVSPLDFTDFRAQNQSFEHLAAAIAVPVSFILTGSGEPEHLRAGVVTGNYFEALGVSAALGRTFQLENEQSGRERVVVLSHGLWQQRFGGDPNVVGRQLTLDNKSFEVLGVMPAGFRFPEEAEMWAPMSFDLAPEMRQRKAHFLRPLGKLKAGVTLAQAQADINRVAEQLAAEFPESNKGWSMFLVPLRERLTGNIRPTLLLLLGAVGFVLLIACANVANLLLVRAAARQKEITIRLALGAGRWRIIRQMLTEGVLLALAGAALGVLIAAWGIDLLLLLSADNLPSTAQVKIDGLVLAFTLGLSLLTGVMFGLVPALHSLKFNLGEALKDGGRNASDGRGRNRARGLLVVLESAVAVILLVGAGLLLRSFVLLQNVNPGFDAQNVLTARLNLSREKYSASQKAGLFFNQLERRLAALPGVEAVGMVSELPLSGQPNDAPFRVEGRATAKPEDLYDADARTVNQHYLQAMRIPLLRGRGFTEQEVQQSAPVAIVSTALVREVFPNEEPLGKRLVLDYSNQTFEIIGVVGDIRHRSLEQTPFPAAYFPSYERSFVNLTLRTTADPLSLAAAVRQEVQALDPDQPVANLKTMAQWQTESVTEPRYRTILLGLFATVALLLAAIGLYGVMSYSVTQRTNEIGIRMALGAAPRDVLRLILRQGLTLTLIGIGLGLAGALALTKLLSSLTEMLYGVSAADPLTFGAIPLLLLLVAFLACYLPARRATKLDPLLALRRE
jgi:predicted permease